jgi:hypothetical protein
LWWLQEQISYIMDLYDGRWFRATTREALCKDSELRACFRSIQKLRREQRDCIYQYVASKWKDWTCLSNLSIGSWSGSARSACYDRDAESFKHLILRPMMEEGRSTGRRVEIIFDLVFPTSVRRSVIQHFNDNYND